VAVDFISLAAPHALGFFSSDWDGNGSVTYEPVGFSLIRRWFQSDFIFTGLLVEQILYHRVCEFGSDFVEPRPSPRGIRTKIK
jgi:hypothetical protein